MNRWNRYKKVKRIDSIIPDIIHAIDLNIKPELSEKINLFEQYIVIIIKEKLIDILGELGARSARIKMYKDNILTIKSTNSVYKHYLLMNKPLFAKKIKEVLHKECQISLDDKFDINII